MSSMKKFLLFLFIFLFPLMAFAKENDKITLYFFHGDGCPHCADEKKFLNKIKKDYSNLRIIKYEVWYNDKNAEMLEKVKKELDVKGAGVPVTIIADSVILGYGNGTGEKIRRAVEYYQKEEYRDVVSEILSGTYEKDEFKESSFSKKEEKSDREMTMKLPLFGNVNLKKVSLVTAAVVIGFIDGFNPCAMWILLFLISILIGMKNRKRMWILGLAFLLTSAFVYMLIMLSWVQVAVKITTIIWLRNFIAFIALLGGMFNLYQFVKTKDDSGCQIVDEKKRKKVFKKIRKFTGEKSFFLALLGVIGLAVSVNLVELACSAGLPLVFTELLALNYVNSASKIFYTLIYIFFFLIDDLVIFFLAMFTMKVTGISSKYNKYSHFLGGIIMVLIGILLLFKPEWLMFQFR